MAATRMDGRALAERIRAEVADEVSGLDRAPGLATVLVGDDAASDIYIRNKHKAAREAGIDALDHRLPQDASEEDVLGLVQELNDKDEIDAVLVQLPLPKGIDENKVIRAVEPVKDVDGFHPFNAGQLYLGEPTHVPATPLGILALLDEYDVDLDGASAVVIGRSQIVGKPVAHLLLQRNATVTLCHSRTRDLADRARGADVLVVATGRAGLVGAEDVKEGATVVDVGINRTETGIVGDVDAAAAERAGLVTPVPGGVGPMTIAMLLSSTVRAARYRRGELAYPLE
ncbi:MAG TPA: bifunctional 5,10-methylenetetrahydrofolate dehydrogenase/5,10-methenyltetrahydrofolate cyclohydrolase [Gaiellaceae bacterium]|nr:bifunctional 5,10-methylenetetrahydrofolate dehydrogenase/5,10-methenyltetrahydrofolate cyclohydrolase [Gaiellaceae bacterium]